MPPHQSLVKNKPEIVKAYLKIKNKLGIDAPSTAFYDIRRFTQKNTQDSLMIPVVCIEFPDYTHKFDDTVFQRMLFGDWQGGSARDFYIENSYGKFAVNGLVYGWAISDSNKAYYGYANWGNAKKLVYEAAMKADPFIDFSKFDKDKDGYVDLFSVIHAGYGAEETGDPTDIWSHRSRLTSPYVTDDYDSIVGDYTKVYSYTIEPEKSNYYNPTLPNRLQPIVSIGVFVHEWGHGLGLPDLYDVDYSGEGLGNWSVMAGGSWGGDGNSPWKPSHFDAWCKEWFGWLNSIIVDTNNFITLYPVEDTPKVYKLWTNGNPQDEYFLIEFRRKEKFDGNLPQSGLLIYHIDWNIINAKWSSNRVNAGDTYGVALEQADGLNDLFYGNNRGDGGDPFPGDSNNTAFDSTGTNPDSRSNYGYITHCGVNQIQFANIPHTKMRAFFYIGPSVSIKEKVSGTKIRILFLDNGIYINFPTKGKVRVKIFDAIGRNVKEALLPMNTGNNKISLSQLKNGIYFLKIETHKGTIKRKLTLIRK